MMESASLELGRNGRRLPLVYIFMRVFWLRITFVRTFTSAVSVSNLQQSNEGMCARALNNCKV